MYASKITMPSSDKEYTVERIVDHRINDVGNDEYLIKWKGYREKTWEPASHLNKSALKEALDLKKRRTETAGKRSTAPIFARSTRNSLATARGVDRSSRSNDGTLATEVDRDPQFARMSGFAAAKKRKRIWTIDKSSTDNDDGDNSDDDDNDDEDYNPLEEESDSCSEADNNSESVEEDNNDETESSGVGIIDMNEDADHNNEDDDHNGVIDDSGDNALLEEERNIVPGWAIKQMVIWRQLVCNDDPRPVFGCDWCGPKVQVGYEGPFSVTSELCPSCEVLKSEGFSTATQRHQSNSGKETKIFYKEGKAVYLCKKDFLIGTTNTVAKKLGRTASFAEAPAAAEKESDLEIKSREPASTDTSADKEIMPDHHDQELTKNDEIHGNDSSSSQTIAREGPERASLRETHSDESSTTVENVGKGKPSSEKETRRKPWAEAETEAGKDMVEEEKPLSVDHDVDAVLDGLAERRCLQQPKGLKEESLPLEAQTDTSFEVPQEGMPQSGAKSQVWPLAQYSFNKLVATAEAYNTIRREKDAVEASLRDVQESLRDAQERYKKENDTLKELVAAIRREKDAVEASLTDVQEDLDIQRDTTNQMLVTLGWWHRRFDKLSALAEAAGVDAAVLKSIRDEKDGR